MEMEYDNTNRGALFRNDDKDPNDDKERDYNGQVASLWSLLPVASEGRLRSF
jgi:hypothetical protein